jgi:hypothetical protein
VNRKVVWSYGGGVQSIAILVLIAQGKLPKPELAIMANTGRERSSTWRYLERYARPLMDEIGLPLVMAGRNLATVDLYAHNGDLLLPCFTRTGKLPTFCSSEWKTFVVRRKLRELGYGPKNPVIMWLGMSLDEVHRLRMSDKKWIKNHWPLCCDCKLRRHECLIEIEKFGLPEPTQSSCWTCPQMRNPEWMDMKMNDPGDFREAIQLDNDIRKADIANGNGGVFLHRSGVPLSQADLTVKEKSAPLFECADSCWT